MFDYDLYKKKEIEKMAILCCQRTPIGDKCENCSFARVDCCIPYRMATTLFEKGYRQILKESQLRGN